MNMAANKLSKISEVMPERDNAKPPFNPKAMSKYSDKNLAMERGISRLERTMPANTPKMKNKMAGSRKLLMNWKGLSSSGQDVTQMIALCKIKNTMLLYR